MLPLSLPDGEPLRVLCLGAHADDIEIGCGATMLVLAAARPLEVKWVVFSASDERAREASRSARLLLKQTRRYELAVERFRDGYFPFAGGEIKDYFEATCAGFAPDVIFTHFRDDRHQDHRVISDLTWNTFRNHLILEYEIPKYDGDLGAPNFFVSIDRTTAARKARHLCATFASQRGHHWFTEETFLGLMRLRGLESCAAEGFAEAFYVRKAVARPQSDARAARGRRRRR